VTEVAITPVPTRRPILMHFRPDLVSRDRLSADKRDEPTGISGQHPKQGTAERGRSIVAASIAGCRSKLGDSPAATRLPDPDADGVTGDWAEVLAAGGGQLMESVWS